MTTLQEAKLTKAKKDHRCDFCGNKIGKGWEYYDSVHVIDGVYHWRTHTQCHELSHWLDMYSACDGLVSEEDFNELVRDEYERIMYKRDPEAFKVFAEELRNVIFIRQYSVVYRHHKRLRDE